MENINYRENMQNVFHKLSDMKLTKKDRKALAGMIHAAYINGIAANAAGDSSHKEDVHYLAQDAGK